MILESESNTSGANLGPKPRSSTADANPARGGDWGDTGGPNPAGEMQAFDMKITLSKSIHSAGATNHRVPHPIEHPGCDFSPFADP